MLEMTGSSSKIEGLIQVLRESNYTILEISRTGRMAMRRGLHTSRVLKALGGQVNGNGLPLTADENLSAEFPSIAEQN
jgi:acetolactate synthase-1/3 small subunit